MTEQDKITVGLLTDMTDRMQRLRGDATARREELVDTRRRLMGCISIYAQIAKVARQITQPEVRAEIEGLLSDGRKIAQREK